MITKLNAASRFSFFFTNHSWRGLTQRTSLVPQTLFEIAADREYLDALHSLKVVGQKRLTMDERKKKRRALDALDVQDFATFLKHRNITIERETTTTLQMNVSLYCNQACNHCHVESSPHRKEAMSSNVVEKCFSVIDRSPSITTIDITGGAPELYSGFRDIVREAKRRNLNIIDRCNLTVLMEPGQEDLPEFLASHGVRIAASLPCYMEKNVNMQRGRDVYSRSIEGLKLLNRLGYGKEGSNLSLDLVYNPGGAFLPPNQADLEREYKIHLHQKFGIVFSKLLTMTNMPIKRFADMLYKANRLEEYMAVLVNGFNVLAVDGVMCRNTLSVGWDGTLYDCDFNQQLQLAISEHDDLAPADYLKIPNHTTGKTIFDINSANDVRNFDILFDNHCFGCTAGNGSSCGGATVS